MPTSFDLPHCSVAIVNKGPVTLTMIYNQKEYPYPAGGKPKVVPFEVAHKHFGFELRGSQMFRNREHFYDSGDETAWYVARATFLPWGWEKMNDKNNPDHIFNPDDPAKDQITKSRMLHILKDTWENKIEGRLVALPETLNAEQYESLPA